MTEAQRLVVTQAEEARPGSCIGCGTEARSRGLGRGEWMGGWQTYLDRPCKDVQVCRGASELHFYISLR